jgi:hypothetical protein
MKSLGRGAGVVPKFSFLVVFAVLCTAMLSAQPYVDAYSSATEQAMKSMLTGDAFEAAAKAIEAGSADLANLATAKAPGYKAPKSYLAHVMSANPDGSVGISTISQWRYIVSDSGKDHVILQLTWGQNAINLAEVGKRGSLFIPGVSVDGKSYRFLIHLKAVNIDEMKYSDEAFNAGLFNSYYSGAPGKKTQYTITCEVLAIEDVGNSVKLGLQMP